MHTILIDDYCTKYYGLIVVFKMIHTTAISREIHKMLINLTPYLTTNTILWEIFA